MSAEVVKTETGGFGRDRVYEFKLAGACCVANSSVWESKTGLMIFECSYSGTSLSYSSSYTWL